jgi:hypothetical protein
MGTDALKEPAASIFGIDWSDSSVPKMEAAGFPEILIPFYQST